MAKIITWYEIDTANAEELQDGFINIREVWNRCTDNGRNGTFRPFYKGLNQKSLEILDRLERLGKPVAYMPVS